VRLDRIAYAGYLQSPKWRRKRDEALKRAGYRCQRCDAQAVEVHHRTYERLGEEWMEDLEALCRDCHDEHHGAPPTSRWDRPGRWQSWDAYCRIRGGA